jgi:hypothetical protein
MKRKRVYLSQQQQTTNILTTMTLSQLQSFATAKSLNISTIEGEYGADTLHGIRYGRGNKIYWFAQYGNSQLSFQNTYNQNTGKTQKLGTDYFRVSDAVEKFIA